MDCHLIEGESNGYLIVSGDKSLLIDCPVPDIADHCRRNGWPVPEIVLHTQVQEEHCREWGSLPAAAVHVHPDSVEVARRSPRFFEESKTVWPPDRPWGGDYAGTEMYSMGGAPTERPPERPLNVAGTLTPGTDFTWGDVRLEVLDLAGCGRRSLGLYWPERGILFSGDLLRAGGFLVNFYDCERSYGGTIGYRELCDSLRRAIALQPTRALPTTGPAIEDPVHDMQALLARWDRCLNPTPRMRKRDARPPLREFGLFKQVDDGIYQNNNFGNMVLFVDPDGHGLLIDPDPCVWESWEENCRIVQEQFDLLEQEAGLRAVEWILITHYHGDHVQYCDLLRERYGATVMATPDVAAVMKRPWDFRYPCCIDWYGFPFDHVTVDRQIAYDAPLRWNATSVVPIRTAGHCWAHAGYIVEWAGQRVVCTGDTIQVGAGGNFVMGLPALYNDTAWPERGVIRTIERLLEIQPDLVLGGHSSHFRDPDQVVLRDLFDAAAEAMGRAAALLHDGNLMRAMTPPGYDAKRPSAEP